MQPTLIDPLFKESRGNRLVSLRFFLAFLPPNKWPAAISLSIDRLLSLGFPSQNPRRSLITSTPGPGKR